MGFINVMLLALLVPQIRFSQGLPVIPDSSTLNLLESYVKSGQNVGLETKFPKEGKYVCLPLVDQEIEEEDGYYVHCQIVNRENVKGCKFSPIQKLHERTNGRTHTLLC